MTQECRPRPSVSVGEPVDAAVESVVHRSGDSAAWLWEAERVASGERVQVVVGVYRALQDGAAGFLPEESFRGELVAAGLRQVPL